MEMYSLIWNIMFIQKTLHRGATTFPNMNEVKMFFVIDIDKRMILSGVRKLIYFNVSTSWNEQQQAQQK